MGSKEIGLAVIGVGGIGRLRARICARSARVSTVAICDIDGEKAAEVARLCGSDIVSEDFRQVIARPEVQAVFVSTSEERHFEPAMAALELGKSVLIEKPFTLSLSEADAILAKAQETGAEVFVGYTQRFRRRFLLAKEAIRLGQLGNVVSAFGKIYITQAVARAVLRRAVRTTPSVNTLTYVIDLLLWYLGGKSPRTVYAQSGSFVFREEFGADDFTWLILTFDDGSVATLGVSWLLPERYPAYTATMEIDLQGTRGSLSIDDSHRDFVLCSKEAIPAPYTPDIQMNVAFPGSAMPGDWALGEFWGPMKEETEAFLRRVATGGATVLADGSHAHKVLEVCLAADASAKAGRPMSLGG